MGSSPGPSPPPRLQTPLLRCPLPHPSSGPPSEVGHCHRRETGVMPSPRPSSHVPAQPSPSMPNAAHTALSLLLEPRVCECYVLSRLTFCDPMDCSLPGSSVHELFPGKNTRASCHFLLWGILPTQGSNPHLLHWQVDSLPLSHLGTRTLGLWKSSRHARRQSVSEEERWSQGQMEF